MTTPVIITVTLFLITIVIIYLWYSIRNLAKRKSPTPVQSLWKLKQITGKSEYEIFHIAAEEKGWSKDQVERNFRRYLEDQFLPNYVKEFLEDGREYIDGWRPKLGNYFEKRVLIFYSFIALVIIGGSLFCGLYIFPRVWRLGQYDGPTISKLARPHLHRARLLGQDNKWEEACFELKRVCELGECEYYNTKKREGICK